MKGKVKSTWNQVHLLMQHRLRNWISKGTTMVYSCLVTILLFIMFLVSYYSQDHERRNHPETWYQGLWGYYVIWTIFHTVSLCADACSKRMMTDQEKKEFGTTLNFSLLASAIFLLVFGIGS